MKGIGTGRNLVASVDGARRGNGVSDNTGRNGGDCVRYSVPLPSAKQDEPTEKIAPTCGAQVKKAPERRLERDHIVEGGFRQYE